MGLQKKNSKINFTFQAHFGMSPKIQRINRKNDRKNYFVSQKYNQIQAKVSRESQKSKINLKNLLKSHPLPIHFERTHQTHNRHKLFMFKKKTKIHFKSHKSKKIETNKLKDKKILSRSKISFVF